MYISIVSLQDLTSSSSWWLNVTRRLLSALPSGEGLATRDLLKSSGKKVVLCVLAVLLSYAFIEDCNQTCVHGVVSFDSSPNDDSSEITVEGPHNILV